MGYNAGGCCMSSSSLIAEPQGRAAVSTSLYDRDLNAWARQQTEALRRRDFEAIDWDNVVEEMDGLRRAQRDPWLAHCEKALECMLLIEHWKSPSVSNLDQWQGEIDECPARDGGGGHSQPQFAAGVRGNARHGLGYGPVQGGRTACQAFGLRRRGR